MNSPYRVHPALPTSTAAPTVGNTIPFPAVTLKRSVERPSPASPKNDGGNKLQKLVKLEGDIRKLPDMMALAYHAVNDARDLGGFTQAYFFRANYRGHFDLAAATGVASVDTRATLALLLKRVVSRLAEPEKPLAFALRQATHAESFPFEHGYWVPLLDRKHKPFGGLLLARAVAFEDTDRAIVSRLSEAYSHAMQALTPPSLLRSLSLPRWALYGGPLAALMLGVIPVPLTALAPFEVVAFEPSIITAPIDGTIASIQVQPNIAVAADMVLFRLDATTQQAEAAITAQKVAVAESRLITARNGAFTDKDMKRSLAVAEKELQLAKAEHDYRLSLLQKTEVKAQKSGLLVYSSKSDWIGKPVRVGEKVMEIANPNRVQYKIDLAVHDAIALQDNARVRLFLDSDPLSPKSAQISEMSYHAIEGRDGAMTYLIKALPAADDEPQRIGLRGTAQVSGDYVPLGFYVLRRPIAALRQYFGI